jgi:hypothetical protein
MSSVYWSPSVSGGMKVEENRRFEIPFLRSEFSSAIQTESSSSFFALVFFRVILLV